MNWTLIAGIGFGAIAASLIGWRLIRRQTQSLTSTKAAHSEAVRRHIEELTTERNQATAILDGMSEGVLAIDSQGRILLMNSSAQHVLGLSSPGKGTSVFEAVRHPDLHELVRDLLHSRQRLSRELSFLQPNERILRVHGVPCPVTPPSRSSGGVRDLSPGNRAAISQGEGQGPAAVLVLQDVTESHRYEQLRKEFVANVSHELKSPLTSIRSLTETLLEGGALEDPANNRRFVQLIDEDAARLARLIDDLLELSQIESQALPLKLSVVELAPLVSAVVSPLQPAIARRNLRISVQVPPGLAVRADLDRLRQVMTNLIDNAVKYNKDQGSVTVSAVREGAWVRMAVADTGIGIPADDLPRIFERFYRVDKARSRELGGTGLGLSIVKHIVEAHGGRISVESRPDQGSTFSFTMPSAP